MVNIVNDWEFLEKYSGEKIGFYQRINRDGKIEIKVQIGKMGYVKEFNSENDKLLIRILSFCGRRRYIRVCKNFPGDLFFK